MVFNYIPFGISQAPHLISTALLIASVVKFKYQRCATVLFHFLIAAAVLVRPSIVFGPAVIGEFDQCHNFLQRFAGAFHFGLALFHYLNRNDNGRTDPVLHFAKALTATFLTLTRLFFAYHLYETRARGIHLSSNFLSSVLLIDGAWAIVEIYQLIHQARTTVADEIDVMCKRTQRWIEGKSSISANLLLWADAAIGFSFVVFNFAFAEDILKPVIRRDFPIDSFHVLFVYDFACHSLLAAIGSLFASQFTIQHQINYISQRILTQAVIFLLNSHGQFVSGIYTSAHLPSFIGSFLYLALLCFIYIRINREIGIKLFEEEELTAAAKKTTKSS